MGKIDGERVLAMEHREKGWLGIKGGKRIRGKTAKEKENENENERGGKSIHNSGSKFLAF